MTFKNTLQIKILISFILACILSISLPEIISKLRNDLYKISLSYETVQRNFNPHYKIINYLISYNFSTENLALILNDKINSNDRSNYCSNFNVNTDKPRIILADHKGVLKIDMIGNSIQTLNECKKFIDLFLKQYEENEKKFIIEMFEFKDFIVKESNKINRSQEERMAELFKSFELALDYLKFDKEFFQDDISKTLLFSLIVTDVIEKSNKINDTKREIITKEEILNMELIKKTSENLNSFKPLKRTILYPSLFVVSFCFVLILLNLSSLNNKLKKILF